ncbi:NUDIX hydrolase [Paenibacillus sp. R14(2021)]|uniref:NUDIX hydrolase n=1 Tax=Paenibacillus sp. R14(2021) TaxID=2859228 RepID=UPI001C61441C|nr:NUDIX hydrolase [Paenibacillus sp. R14(2021)]
MDALDGREFPTLARPINWGPVTAVFARAEDAGDESLVSNVSIIPFVGNKVVVIQQENGRWELPGGTLEEGESYWAALRREMAEELGAELVSYRIFGCFLCESSAAAPYRPYIPYPRFRRVVGYGEVRIVGKPLNPPDGEQIVCVEAVELDEAVRRLQGNGRFELAELYQLAYAICRDREGMR